MYLSCQRHSNNFATVENATTLLVGEREAAKASTAAVSVPWYCFIIVFGATCIPMGAMWDISWHQSIGRDTFWTPAHMVIYLGGALPGMACGWMVLRTTFWGTAEERARSVPFIGFHGPLGAWVTIWGAIAMLTSAPFDNWWHDTYGLDVKILSPPHTLLAIGMGSVTVGALLLVLAWQNRLPAGRREAAAWLFVFMGGILLTMQSLFLTEDTFPNQQHGGLFYKVSAVLFPLIMVSTARASTLRWPALVSAAVYMGTYLFMLWVLPLFHAQPKLAPIYNPITHMVPLPFPLLMIVPALAIDLIMQRLKPQLEAGRAWWFEWVAALGIAVVFVGVLVPVQWYFSEFLISPAAENWFFGGQRVWSYTANVGSWTREFWRLDRDPLTWRAVGWAVLIAWVSVRIGLWRGEWMRQVKR